MSKKFYTTTPIYYGNGVPHIGHFYTSLIADVIHRYKTVSGCDTKFTTGIDENSQKAVIKAEEVGKDVLSYLDEMAEIHQNVWDFFKFDYSDFIRTTSKRHKIVVQEVLQACFDRGDIYEGEYEGMYCVGCESFKKDEDLVYMNKTTGETFPISDKVQESDNIVKVCPDHLKAPDMVKEKNYFFKLSKYQTWLEEFYTANPDFVVPHFRYNEVKAFVERGLEDFSISRETNTFGIPLPFDESQVTYVWFDALFNYYTSCKYAPKSGEDSVKYNDHHEFDAETCVDNTDFWVGETDQRNILHIVGKDIIRFHAIFWPAMLASYFGLGEERDGVIHFSESDTKYLPTQILVNGYFTVDGQKMSKSIGNVIEPITYSKEYSKDLLALYMLSAFTIGRDGDYDKQDAILSYNAKLANNFGNLVNRAIVLTNKLELENGLLGQIDENIAEKLEDYSKNYTESFEKFELKTVLDATFSFLDELNLYITEKEPWKFMKDEEKVDEVKNILYTVSESLRQVAINLYPFFPEKMLELLKQFGFSDYEALLQAGKGKILKNEKPAFIMDKESSILFQKFDV